MATDAPVPGRVAALPLASRMVLSDRVLCTLASSGKLSSSFFASASAAVSFASPARQEGH